MIDFGVYKGDKFWESKFSSQTNCGSEIDPDGLVLAEISAIIDPGRLILVLIYP